ncbi:MAG: Uma2 family endonuclease [Chloroflexota bacterium]
MATSLRWTTADLEALPEPLDGKRYEIIDGELYVSKQPSWEHQFTCSAVNAALWQWNVQHGAGVVAFAPGLIFADDDNVAPDVVWVSTARLPTILDADRKLHAAPELVVEVLSPGARNESRDREAKLKLYSRRGAQEYWIMDPQRRQVEVYRRNGGPLPALRLVATLHERDTLESPLLPGFACPVAQLFASEA